MRRVPIELTVHNSNGYREQAAPAETCKRLGRRARGPKCRLLMNLDENDLRSVQLENRGRWPSAASAVLRVS